MSGGAKPRVQTCSAPQVSLFYDFANACVSDFQRHFASLHSCVDSKCLRSLARVKSSAGPLIRPIQPSQMHQEALFPSLPSIPTMVIIFIHDLGKPEALAAV